jgi:hypothetical protein
MAYEESSSPADILFFMMWMWINSVSVIPNRTSESFKLILLLLVCGCNVFLSSISFFTVSMKVLLNTLHVVLWLEIISCPSCRCLLLVIALFGEPLPLFTNSQNTSGMLFDLTVIF